MFQECYNGVLFCNFVVAWISSQLPEQKEGLFFQFLDGGDPSSLILIRVLGVAQT